MEDKRLTLSVEETAKLLGISRNLCYDRVKNWIYEQRFKHRKEKARGERREAREDTKAKELETRPVQPFFF